MIKVGAHYKPDNSCVFTVWAPERDTMILQLTGAQQRTVSMQKGDEGYFYVGLDNIAPGTRYAYLIDGQPYPDPASFSQPEGVHKASEVIDLNAYQWSDHQWRGLPLSELIIYELHVGTFTAQGTFDAVIPCLDDLVDTGINAIELMPVSQFPGNRNWGYDGVYPYAVQNAYGGPAGLKRLVDACHQKGIAVILDVVYNHLGPEGNYLARFGPYFTNKYCTPWGDAINFDGEWSDGVKDYFCGNIVFWLEHYHIDGLRLDAVHAIFDNNAVSFWDIVYRSVEQLEARLGRKLHLIAESDYNSPKVTRSPAGGGLGFSAQWLDDFHHSLYVLLDPAGLKRYEDFGTMEQLAKAYTDGFVHSGEYVTFRKRRHGASSAGISGEHFVVFNQNHDQVGNRVGGERLSVLIDFERLKLAAAAVLLAPYIPMLFMGEEYAEENPFYYFISHSEEELIRAVREGRRKEFEAFLLAGDAFIDPQDEATFFKSRLNWNKRTAGRHKVMLDWHRELIRLRRSNNLLRNLDKNDIRVQLLDEKGFIMRRQSPDGKRHLLCCFNLSDERIVHKMPAGKVRWTKILDSKQEKWMLPGRFLNEAHALQLAAQETHQLWPLSVTIYQSE